MSFALPSHISAVLPSELRNRRLTRPRESGSLHARRVNDRRALRRRVAITDQEQRLNVLPSWNQAVEPGPCLMAPDSTQTERKSTLSTRFSERAGRCDPRPQQGHFEEPPPNFGQARMNKKKTPPDLAPISRRNAHTACAVFTEPALQKTQRASSTLQLSPLPTMMMMMMVVLLLLLLLLPLLAHIQLQFSHH